MAAIRDAVSTFGNIVGIANSIDANKRQNKRADMDAEYHTARMNLADQKLSGMKKQDNHETLRLWGAALEKRLSNGGSVTPEDLDVFFKNSELDPATFLDPQYAANFQAADKVFRGQLPGNSPKALEAANNLFKNKVMRGENTTKDGKKIVEKRIIGVYPTQDREGVMFDLQVTTDDGKTYTSPITEKRGTSEEDDPFIKVVPIENLMSNVAGQQMMWQMMQQDQFKHAVSGYIGALNAGSGSQLGLAERMLLQQQQSSLRGAQDQASDERDRLRQLSLKASASATKRIAEKSSNLDETPDDIIRAQEAVTYGIADDNQKKMVADWDRKQKTMRYMALFDEAKEEVEGWFTDADPKDVWQKANELHMKRFGEPIDFNLVSASGGAPQPQFLAPGSQAAQPGAQPVSPASGQEFNEDEYLKSLGF